MAKLSVRDLDVRGKRVLVRVDFNVPTELRGSKVRVTDETRIRESLPTINYLREHGAKTILMSHFGRPKGKPVEKYSLRPIGEYLYSLTLPELWDSKWTPPADAHTGIPRFATILESSSDLWPWLALLGGIGLLVDWLLYGRSRAFRLRASRTMAPQWKKMTQWRKAS